MSLKTEIYLRQIDDLIGTLRIHVQTMDKLDSEMGLNH